MSPIAIEPEDRILLCSDGLNEMVSDDAIAAAMDGGTVDDVTWKLIEMANEAGGVDNVTVIVVDALN